MPWPTYGSGRCLKLASPENGLKKILWDKAQNPTRHVSDCLGIERWQLRAALHKIKARGNLRGHDRVIIYEDGDVTDEHGEPIGNIYDEA